MEKETAQSNALGWLREEGEESSGDRAINGNVAAEG